MHLSQTQPSPYFSSVRLQRTEHSFPPFQMQRLDHSVTHPVTVFKIIWPGIGNGFVCIRAANWSYQWSGLFFFFAQRDPAYLYSTARRCCGEVLLLKELHRMTASIPQGSELLKIKLAWYPYPNSPAEQNSATRSTSQQCWEHWPLQYLAAAYSSFTEGSQVLQQPELEIQLEKSPSADCCLY